MATDSSTPQHPGEAKAPAPRRWRWVRRGLVSLAVLLAGWAVATWWGRARTEAQGREELARVVAELDATDHRWRWDDIEADRPAVPDGENSMRVINEICNGMVKWVPEDFDLSDGQRLFKDRESNQRLDAEQLAVLRRALLKQQSVLALAAKLKHFPRGRAIVHLSPVYFETPLPHLDSSRQVQQLLHLDAIRLVEDGKATLVADRIEALLNAGTASRGEPGSMPQLVRIACRATAVRCMEILLGMSEVPDDICKRLMVLLASERVEDLLLPAIRGERAGFHSLFANLETGRLTLAKFLGMTSGSSGDPDLTLRAGAWMYAPRLFEDHAFCLLLFNKLHDAAQGPPWKHLDALAGFSETMREAKAKLASDRRLVMSVMLFPALQKVIEASLRDKGRLGCIHTALAAERFRLANRRWPKSLDELCPAFLPSVPTDPYTGDPLLYAEREDGVVIYSVGQDGEDDDAAELGLTGKPGTDLGVRLFHPGRRGLEPLRMPQAE